MSRKRTRPLFRAAGPRILAMSTPRGAGRSGGLLFLAVLAFVAYLVLAALSGIMKLVATLLLLGAIVVFGANVLRRR